jgi:hypothetical protein
MLHVGALRALAVARVVVRGQMRAETASVVYNRRAQGRSPKAVELGLSPSVRAFFECAQGGDPLRKKLAVVATAHYLVRVMWAMLKHGTLWDERMYEAKKPNAA